MRMRAYAVEQASVLLNRLALRINRASRLADPDSIHDLRVAIRRFTQCIRVFRQFFPAREFGRIRRRLRRIMRLAAGIRNRDIALQLCEEAGLGPNSAAALSLAQERIESRRELVERLDRFRKRELSRKRRKRLGL